MLRRIDRVLAPVTWILAAFAVLVLLVGPELIGADKDTAPAAAEVAADGEGENGAAAAGPDGKALFTESCGGCHTLEAAGTTGAIGPNLDDLAPDAAAVESVVRSGAGSMPAFEGQLSDDEIEAVAAFVAGEEPPAATATATAGAEAEAEATPDATAAPEEAAAAEVEQVPTDAGPDGITVSRAGEVWVANAGAGTLQRFDAATGDPTGDALPVGSSPDNPTVTAGAAWVVLTGDDAVAVVRGSDVRRLPVGDAPEDLAVGPNTVWVANGGDDTVTAIDRATGRVTGTTEVGGRPLGIAVGAGSVWVTSYDESTLTRLDPATGAVTGEPVTVGRRPRGVVVGDTSVWVANAGDGTVSRVDPSTGEVQGKAIPVGRDPRDLAVGDGAIWVAAARDDTVTRIDAATGEPGDPIGVGDDPIGIAAGGGSVWTADFRGDTLSRITP